MRRSLVHITAVSTNVKPISIICRPQYTVVRLQYNTYWLTCFTYVLCNNFSNHSYTLPLHKLKNNQFIHGISLHLSLNITANDQHGFLFHPQQPEVSYSTYHLLDNLSIAVSTMLCDKPFQVLIKRCLRLATSGTGIQYTQSWITPDIRQSTGLRLGYSETISPEELASEFHTAAAWLSHLYWQTFWANSKTTIKFSPR